MTDPKLEKKIEKLLNYKCLNYLSNINKYKSKSSTPNHSSLKDTPNTERSDSKSNKQYPIIVDKHHKNSSLATNFSDLPYIKETRNNNFDKKKQLHSYNNSNIETNITEETKTNEKKSSNNVNQFNSKMTGLMQFKTISKELNGDNSNVVIQRPHKKKPEFSMDFSTQTNERTALGNDNSKSNVLSNNTTRLRVITENSLIKSNRNDNPIKVFNTNSDMIVNRRDKLEPITNVKRTNKYKLTLKKPVNKDLNKILKKEEVKEEQKNQPKNVEESPKSPLEYPDDDRKYYGVGIRRTFNNASSLNKVKDTMKNIIKKSISSSINSVKNPYEPIKDTLHEYYIHLNDETEKDDENIIEMYLEYKYYSNPFPSTFRYYEFTHPECKYILNRYFDCFDELITDFIDSTTTTNKLPIHFDLRRRLSQVPLLKRVDTFDNNSDFDLKNQDYIFRYILKSTTNWYSSKINMKTKDTDPKKKPIIKRSSMRLSLQFSEKHKLSQVFKFKRAKTKLEDYNVFTHKQNLQVVYHPNDQLTKGKYIRSKTHRVTLTMKELSAEEIWNLLLNDIFYNKKNHFMELYIKNINNININRQDDKGNTLLIYSTQNNAGDIAEFLLEKGCDPNIQNIYGNSALHYAISHKYFPISNLLIKYNSSERIRNHLGLMPWECLNKDCENAF